MKRREYLATGAVAGLFSTGGCLRRFGIGGDDESDEYEADDDDADNADDSPPDDEDDDDAADADHEDDGDEHEDDASTEDEEADEGDEEDEDEAAAVEAINELIEDELNPQLETAADVGTIDNIDDDTIDTLSSEIFDQVVAEINAHAQAQIGEDIAEDVDSSEEARDEAESIHEEFGHNNADNAIDALYYAADLVDEIHDLADGGDGDGEPFWRTDEDDDDDDPYPDEEDFEIDRDQYDDPPEQPEREERDSDAVEVDTDATVDEYGELTIDGTVTNVSDDPIDQVVLAIEVYNPDDEYLWGDTAGAEDLDPGASEGFESGWTADEERGEVGYIEIDPTVYDVIDEGDTDDGNGNEDEA